MDTGTPTRRPHDAIHGAATDPAAVVTATVALLEHASRDAVLGERLGHAATSVHVHFTQADGMTIRLDPSSISAEPRITGHAEVQLHIPADLFLACLRGERAFAMAILYGDASYSGPVRRLLSVMPMLRRLELPTRFPPHPTNPGGPDD